MYQSINLTSKFYELMFFLASMLNSVNIYSFRYFATRYVELMMQLLKDLFIIFIQNRVLNILQLSSKYVELVMQLLSNQSILIGKSGKM